MDCLGGVYMMCHDVSYIAVSKHPRFPGENYSVNHRFCFRLVSLPLKDLFTQIYPSLTVLPRAQMIICPSPAMMRLSDIMTYMGFIGESSVAIYVLFLFDM